MMKRSKTKSKLKASLLNKGKVGKKFEIISKHQEMRKSTTVLRCIFINTICNKKTKMGKDKGGNS